MRKVFLISSFLILYPALFTISLILLSGSYKSNTGATLTKNRVAYAALPPTSATFKQNIIQEDSRVRIVKDFFAKYKSELTPFAEDVINSADQYGLDYRLIPAIAMQESNLCKKIIKGSYNCWGFGIYGKKVTRFDNYKEAIYTVTKTLAQKYKTDGLETPDEIMKRYTPSSNGSWANGVNHFMNQLSITL